ncbi:MAG: DUF1593 domain-containing protein [Bacteroidales bacterium]
MKRIKYFISLFVCGIITLSAASRCTSVDTSDPKPRIIISSDIGGTDPDDFQSMIHLFMYADQFRIEGLISSPFGKGRAKDILDMIDMYGQDYAKLKAHSEDFPEPGTLRKVVKQGATGEAAYKGYGIPTEGSEWIIQCARKTSTDPLWVLVWGGIEDIAQALHDAPEISEKIRVYWIGGPNKKWSVNAYSYIAENHPDLWMIEANATYRGWFLDEGSPDSLTNENFFKNYITDRGVMGTAFRNYYKGHIKMGDTPSLAYLMNGDADNPSGESWGGSFTKIDYSSRSVFVQGSSITDTIAAHAVIEYHFKGPVLDIPQDSACFEMVILNQTWKGYCINKGIYGVRYSSTRPESASYVIRSEIAELNGLKGQYVSVAPWPGKKQPTDFKLGANWYTDRPEPELFIGNRQGAKTIAKHREAYLGDWIKRLEWLK